MTARELIEKLGEMPPDAEVVWAFGGSFGTVVGCVIDSVANGDTNLPLLFGAAGLALTSLWSLSQPS